MPSRSFGATCRLLTYKGWQPCITNASARKTIPDDFDVQIFRRGAYSITVLKRYDWTTPVCKITMRPARSARE